MGMWTEAIETRARIIHAQLAAARHLASTHGADPESVSEPYLQLLRSLYSDEYQFAQIADSADLVARFTGPAVSRRDPSVSIVAGVFTDLRDQIRGIAKSIVGLSDSSRLRWPSELDPHLSGVAYGSLIIGVSVPRPSDFPEPGEQFALPAMSDAVFESVRSAVRSLSNVARYLDDQKLDESIFEEYPDPAIRDTVLVAASRLAPSGRRGIEAVMLTDSDNGRGETPALTSSSRKTLNQALAKPLRMSGVGEFEGVVREIDLDARRFEIRQVRGAGAIRCIYDPRMHDQVRGILDSQVRVTGGFETFADRAPRLVAVETIKIVRSAEEQISIPLEDRDEL